MIEHILKYVGSGNKLAAIKQLRKTTETPYVHIVERNGDIILTAYPQLPSAICPLIVDLGFKIDDTRIVTKQNR